MTRRAMHAAPLALAALLGACGSPAPPAPEGGAPREPAFAETLQLPTRDTVQALATAPLPGGALRWLVFATAPGARALCLRSDDGRSWTRASVIDRPGLVYGVVLRDATAGFALHGGTDDAVLLATDDGGASWHETARVPGRFVRLLDDGDDLLLLGSNARGEATVLRTRDGARLEPDAVFEGEPPALVADRATFGGRTFLVGGTAGRGALLERGADGRYRTLPFPDLPNLLSIGFDAAGNGLAVGSRGEALRTTDGGATWRATLSGTDRDLASVVFLAPRRALVCGRDGTVLATDDAGETFRRVEPVTRENLFRLERAPRGAGAFVLGARGIVPWVARPEPSE